MLTSVGDKIYPCSTPNVVGNHSSGDPLMTRHADDAALVSLSSKFC